MAARRIDYGRHTGQNSQLLGDAPVAVGAALTDEVLHDLRQFGLRSTGVRGLDIFRRPFYLRMCSLRSWPPRTTDDASLPWR